MRRTDASGGSRVIAHNEWCLPPFAIAKNEWCFPQVRESLGPTCPCTDDHGKRERSVAHCVVLSLHVSCHLAERHTVTESFSMRERERSQLHYTTGRDNPKPSHSGFQISRWVRASKLYPQPTSERKRQCRFKKYEIETSKLEI